MFFPDLPGLRPTADRIRETLFNWLQVDIVGASCLDLYAGSGALGFEALSRGAEHVVFVDTQRKVIEQLKQNAASLNATEKATFLLGDAALYLSHNDEAIKFDLVFLDPPFKQNLLAPCLQGLQKKALLKAGAKVYIEMEASLTDEHMLDDWHIAKQKTAGNVRYCLLQCGP